jgi:hypothetical protein
MQSTVGRAPVSTALNSPMQRSIVRAAIFATTCKCVCSARVSPKILLCNPEKTDRKSHSEWVGLTILTKAIHFCTRRASAPTRHVPRQNLTMAAACISRASACSSALHLSSRRISNKVRLSPHSVGCRKKTQTFVGWATLPQKTRHAHPMTPSSCSSCASLLLPPSPVLSSPSRP